MVAVAAPGRVRRARGGSARYIRTHWRLLLRVTRHDLRVRNAGSLLGLSWIFLGPLIILGVYSVIYLEVFRVRVSVLGSGPSYVLYIFCGLVPYLATAEALSTGVVSVIANKAVLNNTVFPIDLAPVKSALSAQAVMVAGMPLLVVGAALTGHARWTLVALPVVWALNLVWLTGVNWIISMLDVLFRDLQNLLTAVLMVMLVASPFAYTPNKVPSALQFMLILNPFAYFVLAYQQIIMLGKLPDVPHALVLVLMPIATFAFGSWFFARVKSVVIDYV